MIRIRTPSRLHFGLFSLPTARATAWLNHDGEPTLPRRNFGGVGLMIEQPAVVVEIEFAKTWVADGNLAERAHHFAQTYCNGIGVKEAFRLSAISDAPQHAGFGTGTQLGLAVARGIAELTQQPERDAVTLAKHVGRGLRSALGVHGFAHGGFLVEGGKTSDAGVSPLLARLDFPADWGVLLVMPRDLQGRHGRREVDAFTDLAKMNPDDRATETLCRIVLLGLLPAIQERDLQTFGEALYDFNRRVGEMFRPAQGGLYAHPRIEEVVRTIRAAGVRGVGQSSWGPTVFAIVPADDATRLGEILDEEVIVTSACNHGATSVIV